MGAHLRVKVPPRAGHSERSEAQLREGDRAWEGSVERKSRVDEQEPHRRRCQAGRASSNLQSPCDHDTHLASSPLGLMALTSAGSFA